MPELRQFGGDYRDMFPALLPTLEFVPYDVCMGQFPAGVDDCEAWLCTGSRYSVYDGEGWIQELKDLSGSYTVRRKNSWVFVSGISCWGRRWAAGSGRASEAGVSGCILFRRFRSRTGWLRPWTV